VDGVVAIAAGDVHTCARHAGGVACWGANETGQLGDGTSKQKLAPVSVAGFGH
jgi:alpha-tubulin suppressor-like RCC1 family protein